MSEHVLDELDDWLDQGLPEGRRGQIAAHLAGCSSCADEYGRAEAVSQWAKALPPAMSPPPSGFAAIAERLAPPPLAHPVLAQPTRVAGPRPPPMSWLLAAAVLLAAVAGALSWQATPPVEPPTLVAQHTPGTADLKQAAASLVLAVDARRDTLDPAAAAEVARNLALIDAAIIEIEALLAGAPGNERAGEALVAAYSQKIRVLQQTLRLPHT